MSRTKSHTGVKFFLALVAIAGALIVWWWIASAVTCKDQDEHTLRGVCLMQIRDRAENGDKVAQWLYGNYLLGVNQKEKAYEFHRKAFAQASRGLDLEGLPLAFNCAQKIPGFEPAQIEATMVRVADSSPDAHLGLLQFYLDNRCMFSLDKASTQIPKLTQCANATLEHFLRIAKSHNYVFPQEALNAMYKNMDVCTAELTNRPVPGQYMTEVTNVRQQDIEELKQSLQVLAPDLKKSLER